jgi:hypothetical protein
VDLAFSGPSVPVDGEFQRFTIAYDGTSATFFIDGALVATITTNIPTTKTYGYGFYIDRTVNNLGTPSGLIIDYLDLRFRRSL